MIIKHIQRVRRIGILIFASSILSVMFLSCNKSGSLGTDLFSDDWIYAKGTDYTNLKFSSIPEDSIIFSYADGSAIIPAVFYLGKVKDPVFGNYEAEFYSQLSFAVTKEVGFLKNKIDSVVLSIRYDTLSFFGDPAATHTVRVYPLIDTLYLQKNYYHSDLKHRYSNTELGSLVQFVPNMKDSIQFELDSVQYSYAPQMRIPLDTGKVMGILRSFEDSVYNSLSLFNTRFPGIALISEGQSSLLGLNPLNSQSGITIFYTTDQNKKAQFTFSFGSMRVANNSVDNSGSQVEPFVKNLVSGDSLCFLQGFNGHSLKVQIPYDNSWEGKLVNYAVLEVYSPNLSGDNSNFYDRPAQLFIKDLNAAKPYPYIIDSQFGSLFGNLSDLAKYFGGNISRTTVNGEEVVIYRFNITGHFIKSKKLKKEMNLMITQDYFKVQKPDRLILGGPLNSKYGAKLKLVFSED